MNCANFDYSDGLTVDDLDDDDDKYIDDDTYTICNDTSVDVATECKEFGSPISCRFELEKAIEQRQPTDDPSQLCSSFEFTVCGLFDCYEIDKYPNAIVRSKNTCSVLLTLL